MNDRVLDIAGTASPYPSLRPRALAATVLAICAGGAALDLRAEDADSWSGIAVNDNWSNAFNWHKFTPPISNVENTDVLFQAVATRTVVDLNADWSVRSLTFSPDPGTGIEQSFTLYSSNGSTLTLGAGGITNQTGEDQIIEHDIVLAADQVWDAQQGDLILRGTRSGSARLTIASLPNGVRQSPGHVVFLGGDGSQHTGDVAINSGTLRLGNVDAISDQSTVILGEFGTLDLFNTAEVVGGISREAGTLADFDGRGTIALGSGSLTFGVNHLDTTFFGHLTGTGAAAFIKDGRGTTVLERGNNSAYLGRVEVRTGTLHLGIGDNIGAASAVTVNANAVLRINVDGEDFGSLAGAGQVDLDGQDLRVGGNNTSTVFTGAITGSGNFFKAGRGIMTLQGGDKEVSSAAYQSGVNTFTGHVTVMAGVLVLGVGDTLSNGHSVTVDRDAELRLAGDDESIGGLAGAGVVTLNGFDLAVGFNDADTVFSGRLAKQGDLLKGGTGTLTLSGVNDFDGHVRVEAGTLELGVGDTLGNTQGVTVARGARLKVSGDDEQLGSLDGEGDVELVRTLGVGHDDGTSSFSGSLTGAAGLSKAGRGLFDLRGTSQYEGVTTVTAGFLRLLGDARLGDRGGRIVGSRELAAHLLLQDRAQWSVEGDVMVGQDGPAQLRLADESQVTVSGTTHVAAAGAVIVSGGHFSADVVTVAAGGTFDFDAGAFAVNEFHGDLVNTGGTLAPGHSPGTTTVFGDYTQLAGGTLEIELASLSAFDVLRVQGGDAHLGGTLVVRLLDGFEPGAGAEFRFLQTDGAILGSFATVILPSLAGKEFRLDTSDGQALRLVVRDSQSTPAPVPLPPAAALMAGSLAAVLLRARRRPGARRAN